jgi:hypothetical protein
MHDYLEQQSASKSRDKELHTKVPWPAPIFSSSVSSLGLTCTTFRSITPRLVYVPKLSYYYYSRDHAHLGLPSQQQRAKVGRAANCTGKLTACHTSACISAVHNMNAPNTAAKRPSAVKHQNGQRPRQHCSVCKPRCCNPHLPLRVPAQVLCIPNHQGGRQR